MNIETGETPSAHKGREGAVARQADHYAQNASRYVESREAAPAYRRFLEVWTRRLLSSWLDAVPPDERRGQVVLDPMCGHGNLGSALLEHSDRVVLNDVSPEMLNYMDEGVRRRSRVLAASDVCDLPLEDASVDVVVISGGLHHVSACLNEALVEIHRVLKPGGRLLFGEPSDDFWMVRMLRRGVYRRSDAFEDETERGFTYEELRRELSSAGFSRARMRPFGSVGYLLMGQLGVVPLLRNVRSRPIFAVLQGVDRVVESIPLLRRTCFALTGEAIRE